MSTRGPTLTAERRRPPLRRDGPRRRRRTPTADERAVEAALRPKRLDEFIGQARVREQLDLVLEAARRRGRPPDHVLLSGPPGLGKTTLAMIIAAELSAPLRITSGPAIQHAGDLAAILSTLTEGEVLFLDEIHRMARPAEEMLYLAMEDFRVDVVVGKGPGATAIPLELAAVHRWSAPPPGPGCCPAPLRDRFGFTAHLDFYAPAELERMLHRSAGLLGVDARRRRAPPRSPGGPGARPRIANRLLRRVRDCAQVHGRRRRRPAGRARGAGALRGRRPRASTGSTGRCSTRCCRRFGGGPVGLSHARRRRGRGARDRRDGGRAVPGARGLPRPHAARPGRHAAAWRAPRADAAAPVRRARPAALPVRRHGDGRFGGERRERHVARRLGTGRVPPGPIGRAWCGARLDSRRRSVAARLPRCVSGAVRRRRLTGNMARH